MLNRGPDAATSVGPDFRFDPGCLHGCLYGSVQFAARARLEPQ
jgi:hypothetical protein